MNPKAITNTKVLLIYFLTGMLWLTSCFPISRSKEKIYADAFGKGGENCTQIIEAKDAVAIDDCCVFIHFKTCPAEVKRVLSLVRYDEEPLSKSMMQLKSHSLTPSGESSNAVLPPWWTLTKLGDSCLSYEFIEVGSDHAQMMYVSLDSTEVFFEDMHW